MSRMPFKKRSPVFLDSCSESDDDESFAPDDDDKSEHYMASDDDEFICTQPTLRTIKAQTTSAMGDGSLVMDAHSLEAPVNCSAGSREEQTESPVATSRPSTLNVVTNDLKPAEFSDSEHTRIEILEPTDKKKPSKLRLKFKMNRSTSQKRKSKNSEEDYSSSKSEKKFKTHAIDTDKTLTEMPRQGSDQTDGKRHSKTKENTPADKEIHNIEAEARASEENLKDTNNTSKITTNKSTSPAQVVDLCGDDNSKSHDQQAGTKAPPQNSGIKRKKKRKVGKQPKAANITNPSHVGSKSSDAAPKSFPSNASVTPPEPKLKPKKKKKTFQQQVLLHLITSMKPFTLKTLAAELRTTDVVLSHLMLSLLDKNIVRKKEFGKKIKKELYWVDLETATKEFYGKNLPTRDAMQSSKAELNIALGEEVSLMEILKGMESELSNEELRKRLEEAEKTGQEMRTKMQDIKYRIEGKTSSAGTPAAKGLGQPNPARFARYRAPPKKPKTRKQLNKEINSMRTEWKSRKEKCMDFIDNLADAMEKRPKEVNKMLEIETDEMMGVKIPAKKVLD